MTIRATFIGVGASDSGGIDLSPTVPAQTLSGDILLMFAGNLNLQTTGLTPNAAPSGWSTVASPSDAIAFIRRASGDASDNVTHDPYVEGTAATMQMAAFRVKNGGLVPADPNQRIVTSTLFTNSATDTIPTPALTLPTIDGLLVAFGRKSKSPSSNGVTAPIHPLFAPRVFSDRIDMIAEDGFTTLLVWDFLVTEAIVTVPVSEWSLSVAVGSTPATSIMMFLPLAPTTPLPSEPYAIIQGDMR